jgi:hypothetical protein
MDRPSSIEISEMRENLRELFTQDEEARILTALWRYVADPVKPQDQNGRFRPHPLLLLLGVIVGTAVALFLYFTYAQ